MKEIIVTTPEELRTLIERAVKSSIPTTNQSQPTPPDTIALPAAQQLLADHGYPTSRAKIYKLTSANLLPHKKYGNKLVFSRRDLLAWAESQTHKVDDRSEAVLAIARSARRKQ